jgi:hypothetical protein
MEQQKQTLITNDPEKTLVSPRFIEEAISRPRAVAHPGESEAATPPQHHLRQAAKELTLSRLALALVLVSMLASGVIGALATVLYYRHAVSGPPAAAPEENVSENDARGDVDMTQQRTAPVDEADKRPLIKSVSDQEEAQGEEEVDRPQEDEHQRSSLRDALNEWIATTNARDINRQREFYMPKVDAFYRSRNVSREAVLADKGRAFGNADLIDVRAGQPEITINPDGRTATMRFRKHYAVRSGQHNRRGEVLQELRWRRTGKDWKIMSERDVKVIQ